MAFPIHPVEDETYVVGTRLYVWKAATGWRRVGDAGAPPDPGDLPDIYAAIAARAPILNPIFEGNVQGVTKAHVGLGNVANLAPAALPISDAAQAALDALTSGKAPKHNADFSGTTTGITKAMVGLGNVPNLAAADLPVSNAAQAALDAHTSTLGAHEARLDEHDVYVANHSAQLDQKVGNDQLGSTVAQLVGGKVPAGQMPNTDEITEGATNQWFTLARVRGALLAGLSTATNAVITASDTIVGAFGKLQKQISDHLANTANPHATTATQVGLGNVNNTSDANKPVSTATANALALKANLAGATFSGNLLTLGQFYSASMIAGDWGYQCKGGVYGSLSGNVFNFHWAGSVNAYIDGTYVGTIQMASDERIKHEIQPAHLDEEAFRAIRPITYRFRDIGVFKDDGRYRFGFSAQNLAGVFPEAVDGSVEALDRDGLPAPALVLDRPLLALVVLQLQRALERIDQLEALMPGDCAQAT